MSSGATVLVTRNFEHNLDEIERFLTEADAGGASFDDLLDMLANVVVPHLERHPDLGRDFLARPALSIEAEARVEKLTRQLSVLTAKADERPDDQPADRPSLREYVMAHYVVLYVHVGDRVHLLAIRHHRQLSFDFDALWLGTP
ncbi:type II toxin-antitoxin system RelE/ParE family toxin [Azoarcus sp. PA01]|nr:type II toxin-antitoxin system RelE/ParE family toxin [Azoarcus sp. PA01]